MKIIDNIKDINGKIVKEIKIYDTGTVEQWVMIFTDDTMALLMPRLLYENDLRIELDTSLSNYDKLELGFITKEEYIKIEEKDRQKMINASKNADLRKIKELAKKHGISVNLE